MIGGYRQNHNIYKRNLAMSATDIVFKFTLCIFIAAGIYSDGVFAAKIALKPRAHHELHTRQGSCEIEFDANFPKNICNLSLLTEIFPSASSSAELARLNAAYTNSCIPACINPLAKFYRCSLPSMGDYAANQVQNGICGQVNGEYCPVRLARLNVTGENFDSCSFGDSGIACNSTTSNLCRRAISTLVLQMGDCASPYLGAGVRTCIITTSPASGAYPFPAVLMIAFTLFGLFL